MSGGQLSNGQLSTLIRQSYQPENATHYCTRTASLGLWQCCLGVALKKDRLSLDAAVR